MTNREAIREAIREYADDLPFGVEHRRRVDELDLWLSPILASAIRELRTEYTLALDAWLEQLTARGARTRENRCKTTTLTLPGPIENRCGTTGFITTADAKTVAAQRLSTDGHAFLKSWGGDPSGVSCAPPRLAERSCRGVPETRWGATVSGPLVRVGSLVPQRFPGSTDA